MLAAPQCAYYLYFPPGFRDYLLARHSGNLPFEPSQYLLRVQKNIYGATDLPSRRRLPHIFMSQHLYAGDVRVDAEEADELRLNHVRSL